MMETMNGFDRMGHARRRMVAILAAAAILLPESGADPDSISASASRLAIPSREYVTGLFAGDDSTRLTPAEPSPPVPETVPAPAAPQSSDGPIPPPPLHARAHGPAPDLDHSEDFELTGELLPLNQAQSDIINSLNIPVPDKEQVTTLMRGAMTLWARGIPVNAEAMVASGILESGKKSGWKDNSLARYNNFWGMKARPEVPADQKRNFNTVEYENGGYTDPQPAWFLIFPTESEGIEGYGEFLLDRWWYRDALEDPAAISDPGVYMDRLLDGQYFWTPTPTYKTNILKMIADYRLSEIADAR